MIKQRTQLILLVFALIVSCLLSFTATPQIVFASSVDISGGYTNVMEDLQKDENFDASKYPVVENDYSLQVIQVAESSDKELFLYVYQPSGNIKNFVASYVNMAIGEHSIDFKIYYLTLINSNGVFYKYLVKNVAVSDEVTRSYNITSIFRPFDKTIDESVEDENGNIISNVSYDVSKFFTITDENGQSQISSFDTDVVHITDKYVGFIRYEGPGNWIEKSCDRHFVAFSTDKQIDKLLEADVFYRTQKAHFNYLDNTQLNNVIVIQ